MNSKRINEHLAKKFDDFLKSITDKKVKKLVKENSIITGGSIVSLLTGEKPKDYDVYFTDKDTCIAVAKYYVQKFRNMHKNINIQPTIDYSTDKNRVKIIIKSAGVVSENGDDGYKYFEQFPDEEGMQYVERVMHEADETNSEYMENIDTNVYDGDNKKKKKKKSEPKPYRPIFMSSNAITLSNKVQLILRFFGSPEEIHKNYDFVHCTNYWTSVDEKLVLQKEALESILTKNLVYMGSLYPVCSVIRTRKFIRKGWNINAGNYLKMMMQISELDLTDINVLEEQLTGVDTAYFTQLIDYCKAETKKDNDFKITTPYIVSLVDKLF